MIVHADCIILYMFIFVYYIESLFSQLAPCLECLSEHQVQFVLSDKASSTVQAFGRAATPFEVTGGGKPKASSCVSYLTADGFKASSTGKANMIKYVEALQHDFDTLHYPLVGADGLVEITTHIHGHEKVKVPWEKLLAQGPGYLLNRQKGMKDKSSFLGLSNAKQLLTTYWDDPPSRVVGPGKEVTLPTL